MRTLLILSLLCLAGCNDAFNKYPIDSALKVSADGLKYKLVVIEGRTFVATRAYGGYWMLTGPIDK